MDRLSFTDWMALSPLLIILMGSLIVLLTESFFDNGAKKWVYPITLLTIITAFYATLNAGVSENILLTPWLKFDSFAKVFNELFLIIGFASAILAGSFFESYKHTYPVSKGEFFFFLLSAVFGLMLIGSSADFLTLFLGIETLSLALYILCGYMKGWSFSNEASLKYFFMGSLAAAFLLYGIALIYGATGSTAFEGLLEKYHALAGSEKNLFLAGTALVTLALLFEAALIPFHFWAPDVYQGSPNPVVAFMATGTKAGAFAALARVFLDVLPGFNPLWSEMVVWIAIPSLIWANLVALKQTQIRRFFAYSGISHAAFLLLPLTLAVNDAVLTSEALSALVFYLSVYVLATLGSFAVLSFIDERKEGTTLDDLTGLFHRYPFLASCFTLALLTLAGIPPTVGFFAKFYVFKIAFTAGHIALVVVALATTILSAYYYLRIIGIMLKPVPSSRPIYSDEEQFNYPTAILAASTIGIIVLLTFYPDLLPNVFTIR